MAPEERDRKRFLGSHLAQGPAVDALIMIDSDNLCQNISQKSLAGPWNFSENTWGPKATLRKNRSRALGIFKKFMGSRQQKSR